MTGGSRISQETSPVTSEPTRYQGCFPVPRVGRSRIIARPVRVGATKQNRETLGRRSTREFDDSLSAASTITKQPRLGEEAEQGLELQVARLAAETTNAAGGEMSSTASAELNDHERAPACIHETQHHGRLSEIRMGGSAEPGDSDARVKEPRARTQSRPYYNEIQLALSRRTRA
jgi:hypothetical protein